MKQQTGLPAIKTCRAHGGRQLGPPINGMCPLTHPATEPKPHTLDYAAVDWGTVVARRAKKEPPSQGGWNMYITNFYGVDTIDPTNKMICSGADLSVNGWSSSPAIEVEVSAWCDAKNLDEEKLIARRLNRAALNHVVYAPLGVFLKHIARRKNLVGVGRAPLPLPWG
jgi:peptide/nickel transport system substrate-binding protein